MNNEPTIWLSFVAILFCVYALTLLFGAIRYGYRWRKTGLPWTRRDTVALTYDTLYFGDPSPLALACGFYANNGEKLVGAAGAFKFLATGALAWGLHMSVRHLIGQRLATMPPSTLAKSPS